MLVVVATYASVVTTGAEPSSWAGAATLAELLLLPTAFGSAVLVCIGSRLNRSDGVAWVAAATTMIGIQTVPTLVIADTTSALTRPAPISSAIVLGLALLLLVKLTQGHRLSVAPIPAGVGIGLFLILIRALWSHAPLVVAESRFTPPFALSGSTYADVAGSAMLMSAGMLVALVISRTSVLPGGQRRIVIASLLWPVPQALSNPRLTEIPAWSVVAIICGLLTCVLLASAALDLLWLSLYAEQVTVHTLESQLLTLHTSARAGVEQLHEVKGTIAGIASASDLIRHEARLSAQHRERLEELLVTESARLKRLVHAQDPDQTPPTPEPAIELTRVIPTLVLAHSIQGRDVSWQAPANPVRVDGDDVVEAINILLDNAAEHAPGAPVRIFTRDGGAELVIADDGPGVPTELREQIFGWGFSQPGSHGQGVGLAMAKRLLEKHGRTLQLDADQQVGAAFVIGLRTPDDLDEDPGPGRQSVRSA